MKEEYRSPKISAADVDTIERALVGFQDKLREPDTPSKVCEHLSHAFNGEVFVIGMRDTDPHNWSNCGTMAWAKFSHEGVIYLVGVSKQQHT
ncbi:hypothetical protein Pelo_1785 [Pelomyxa schiedti]|nr:hypothetical protein Pelo_1785 [Pelomyxa schiedti]